MRKNCETPLAKFKKQIRGAKRRGIGWMLSYEQWLEIWMVSGKWPMRGQHKGQYVMARKGDVGPYASGNVYICLHSENVKDAYKNKAGKNGGFRSLGTGKGWSISDGKYVVSVRHKVIGRFFTQREAETAYKDAVEKIKARQA